MLILDAFMLVLGVLCALFVLIYNIFKHHVSFPIPFEGLLSSVKQTMERDDINTDLPLNLYFELTSGILNAIV